MSQQLDNKLEENLALQERISGDEQNLFLDDEVASTNTMQQFKTMLAQTNGPPNSQQQIQQLPNSGTDNTSSGGMA